MMNIKEYDNVEYINIVCDNREQECKVYLEKNGKTIAMERAYGVRVDGDGAYILPGGGIVFAEDHIVRTRKYTDWGIEGGAEILAIYLAPKYRR